MNHRTLACISAENTLARIGEVGIIPVIRAGSADEGLCAVEAIYEAGIPIVEITMTVPDAPRLIARTLELHDNAILVGAGTVTSAEDARRCIEAGARFLVSPGLSVPVLTTGQALNVLAIPGAVSGEAGYSFLGLGVQDPIPSWGKMITEGGRYIRVDPLFALLPIVLFALTMLSFSFVGDGLRDALDPNALE